jgi:hypothetical protein
VAGVVLALVATAACRSDMHDQPKYEPLEQSAFFPDRRASRPPMAGTVARGHLDVDSPWATGKDGGQHVATVPIAVTRPVVERGAERYDIYCAPCHDRVGYGRGMIVLRGYKQPPSFHEERLRAMPAGYFFDVMTNGFGTMPSYAPQIPIADRWAITSYIRALQRSQHAAPGDVPAEVRAVLDTAAADAIVPAPGAPPAPDPRRLGRNAPAEIGDELEQTTSPRIGPGSFLPAPANVPHGRAKGQPEGRDVVSEEDE